MATFRNVIGEARKTLNDTVTPYRYPDDDLMIGVNDAMRVIRKTRPDLFIGSLATPFAEYAADDSFPIGLEYITPLRSYIIAYAEMRESEDALQTRSAAFFSKFERELQTL